MVERVRSLARDGMDWGEATARVGREFAEALRASKVVEPPPPLPAPVEPGREARDDDKLPKMLPGWRTAAEALGWRTRVVVSRGWKIDAKGAATGLVDAISLRMVRGIEYAAALWQDGGAAGAWRWERGTLPVRVGHEALQVLMGVKAPKKESAGQRHGSA